MKEKQVNNELFENIFEFATIGMALVSPEGKFLKVNKSLCQLLGRTEEEINEIDFQSITHPDDLKNDVDLMKEVIDGKRDSYQLEKRYYHKNGSIVWTILGVSLIRNKDGSPKHFISQIQDISERKNKEEQLNLVIATTYDGFWDWKIQENFLYMSPRFWQIFGYSPEEKGHTPDAWQGLIFEEDLEKALKNFDMHIQTKGRYPYDIEARYHHKSGSQLWMRCKGKVVEWDKEGKPVRMVGTHTDITEYKKIQMFLDNERASRAHSARMASLGEMAGTIAHEINNPLAVVSGHAAIIESCVKKDNPELKPKIVESIGVIKSTVQRMNQIIKGLKYFTRDGSQDEYENCNVKELFQEIEILCKDRCLHYGIELSMQKLEVEKFFWGQKVQMAQVLVNLINNSLDAIKGIEEKWVKVSFEDGENSSCFHIEDSGNGIPQEIQDRIMLPFFTTKKAGEGTGLGLSLSKNIIEKHNGKLSIDNNASHTKFIIELPHKDKELKKAS